MQIRFERVGLNELETLQSISIETFKDTFEKDNTEQDMADYLSTACSKEKLKAELENDNAFFYFLYFEDELAGYMKLNLKEAQTENIAPAGLEIERIYIRKDYKRKGLGSIMLDKAFEMAEKQDCTSVWLGVWEHNEPAKAFYRTKGFEKVGTHSFYMGEDKQLDWIMQVKLLEK
ncbi:spermidine/spermine N(1)-acetyltransferase [Alkalibacterium psychrotolerans]